MSVKIEGKFLEGRISYFVWEEKRLEVKNWKKLKGFTDW